jgi:hypothetical protein
MSASNFGVKPEDILSDTENTTNINGLTIRKGTIAAFLKNIEILENSETTEQQKANVIYAMKELAPGVVAAGLCKHAVFKNQTVQDLLDKFSSK